MGSLGTPGEGAATNRQFGPGVGRPDHFVLDRDASFREDQLPASLQFR
jgi:hypothetical protein